MARLFPAAMLKIAYEESNFGMEKTKWKLPSVDEHYVAQAQLIELINQPIDRMHSLALCDFFRLNKYLVVLSLVVASELHTY